MCVLTTTSHAIETHLIHINYNLATHHATETDDQKREQSESNTVKESRVAIHVLWCDEIFHIKRKCSQKELTKLYENIDQPTNTEINEN